jgi:hypothetical protein
VLIVVAWRLPIVRELRALPRVEDEQDWVGGEAQVRAPDQG